MNKHNVKKRKTGIKGLRFFGYLCLFVLLAVLLLKYTNERVMPSVIKIMESYGESKAMKAIDGSVKVVIENSGITTSDLYYRTTGDDGRLMSLSANTMLINRLCADVAEAVLDRLNELQDETVYLPLGAITGIDFLATKGPPVFEITVKPMGHCVVDYKSSFKSEGINQVNYQIWLEINTSVSVVNPALSKSFKVERKLPIVNTYISGDVPGSMLYPFKINDSTVFE